MKRIIAILIKDLKTSSRDFILGYILIAPLLIALFLRLFIPSMEDAPVTFALHENVGQKIISTFEDYGKVLVFSDQEALKEQVRALGDIEGLYVNDQKVLVVLQEGNEKTSYTQLILKKHFLKKIPTLYITDMSVGTTRSPVATVGGICVIITAITLSGMFLGLSIVEDREHQTIKALTVTPMSKLEYVLGKSLLSFVLTAVHTLLTVYICGLMDTNIAQIFVLSMVSCSLALVFGFFIGATGKNQMESMATAKILFMFIGFSIVGGLLLPTSYQMLLYWSPFYWSFKGLYGIITTGLSWGLVAYYAGIIFILSAGFFLILRNKIRDLYIN